MLDHIKNYLFAPTHSVLFVLLLIPTLPALIALTPSWVAIIGLVMLLWLDIIVVDYWKKNHG